MVYQVCSSNNKKFGSLKQARLLFYLTLDFRQHCKINYYWQWPGKKDWTAARREFGKQDLVKALETRERFIGVVSPYHTHSADIRDIWEDGELDRIWHLKPNWLFSENKYLLHLLAAKQIYHRKQIYDWYVCFTLH